jgi:pimeloyl-ACP methyl ester carboxylesterase
VPGSQTGGELHVIERPPRPKGSAGGDLVALVHGSMDRASTFNKLALQLTDFTVVFYDRRGYAGSRGRAPSPSFEAQVDDLIEVLAGRRAVVAGHSLGGDVALAAAQHDPGLIRAVVAYEPPQPWLPFWANHSAGSVVESADGTPADAAERFMRRMVGDEIWERLPARTRQQRRAEGPALVAELRSLRTGAPPFDAAAITVPVILGHGSNSRPHHVKGTRWLAEQMPNAELEVVEGAGHGGHRSHPAAFAALIRTALARAERRGG